MVLDRLTQNVNMTDVQSFQRLLNQIVRRLRVLHRPLNDSHLSSKLVADVGRNFLGSRSGAVRDMVNGYRGAVSGKGSRNGGTDAVFSARTSDEGSFASEREGVDGHD